MLLIPTIFHLYHVVNKLHWNGMIMMMMSALIDQHAKLEHYSSSSLIQHSMSFHSDTLFWFRTSLVFVLTPKCCVLSGEATHTSFIVFIVNIQQKQSHTTFYEKNVWTAMVINSTNTNKMNNHLSPVLTEHKNDQGILRSKSMSQCGTDTKTYLIADATCKSISSPHLWRTDNTMAKR